MSRYEQEQRQIDDAIKALPSGSFKLRAFPDAEFRVGDRLSHFVLEGEVQIVVQVKNTDGVWRDFGREAASAVRREIMP